MLSERLRQLLNERKISVNEFAEMCDVPQETIRNIYYGKSGDPKLSTALKIAEALEMSVNCLVGKCPHTAEERAIIHNYRNCGKHGKSIIELIARYEASAMKVERDRIGKHKIPCYVPQTDIRKGIIFELCDTIEIETTIPEAFLGIQMTNNDLAPSYCKGDTVLLENRFPINGEVAVFYKKDRAYIRKFLEENGQYRLKCLHRFDEDIIVKRMDEMEYIGTCVGVLRT